MPTDAHGWMRPGSDPRDDDLSDRERQAIRNENSGSPTRRQEVISRRAASGTVKGNSKGGRD